MKKNIFKKLLRRSTDSVDDNKIKPQLTPFEQALADGRIVNKKSNQPEQKPAADKAQDQLTSNNFSAVEPTSGNDLAPASTLLTSPKNVEIASRAEAVRDRHEQQNHPSNFDQPVSERQCVGVTAQSVERVDAQKANSKAADLVDGDIAPFVDQREGLGAGVASDGANTNTTQGSNEARAERIAVSRFVTPVTIEQSSDPLTSDAEQEKRPWLERLKTGLSRSSQQLSASLTSVFTKRKLDEETLQQLEDLLIQADLGVETTLRITDSLSSERYGKEISNEAVRAVMSSEIERVLHPVAQPLELNLSHRPHVILVVGVNGTGKTTTIGKLAAKLTANGLKVMLAAGDTFRAAAIEQLHIWGQRIGAPVVSTKLGADAASLAFDAYQEARNKQCDVLIIDTAGRLQNKKVLMDELAKIVRVLTKIDPKAPHTVLQTLDATTGQNALNQVEMFRNVAGVNGLVMTKLDGTARGGILVAIAAKYKIPVHFIGVGEGIEDLEPFSASEFAAAITGL